MLQVMTLSFMIWKYPTTELPKWVVLYISDLIILNSGISILQITPLN